VTYPPPTAPHETWLAWVKEVAPYKSVRAQGLHPDLHFLSGIKDRELAALSARGTVGTLRKNRQV